MSNPNDRCAREGCGKRRFDFAVHPGSGQPGSVTHSFGEPAPQAGGELDAAKARWAERALEEADFIASIEACATCGLSRGLHGANNGTIAVNHRFVSLLPPAAPAPDAAAPGSAEERLIIHARDNEHAAVIAALQRTVETLGADVLRLAGENDALCRALARYADGQANDEKRIDGLRALLKRMGIDDPSGAMALFRIDDEVAAGIADPPQPEPGKAHPFVFDGFHAITRWCRVCSNPDGPPWHAVEGKVWWPNAGSQGGGCWIDKNAVRR